MTTIVKTYKNRRSATTLLKGLGRKPYEYDNFVHAVGPLFQVTVQDGVPVSKMALLAATSQVAEALTQAATTVAQAVETAQAAVEATVVGTPLEAVPTETPAERAKRQRAVAQLARRYQRLEERAAKQRAASVPRPRKPRPKKPRSRKLRASSTPRSPALDEATVAELAKSIKAKSVGPAILELYLAGRTTAEVWLIIRKRFKTPLEHRHYPSWYLCHYRRKGKLPTPGRETPSC